ncbi:CDP-diacylglycerol--glycerol-3-phosphate 3-phosphatidyltransferase [Paenibacillus pectinilyticus]|uniref:Phosphatidylglycerophosphate synthase n=1 Tax=Paenibacillus pectinilyticus TaxID=512399 RepID=A0A1C0ZYC9_9BACL|nr:CDP-alcohol phosphatidyltransferase family protein [Paenibacillus pectinilyticus]OCT13129.1 CDP-diacylglycerol--glycerol-3-phosphate 3-phosphatidyltransferase [Paenibacillus pectinilyticus]
MNIPNMLTFSRFVLIPVYLVLFFNGHIRISFVILLVAGLTDILDGYIARTRKLITPMGVMLDPLADKCMMIAVILSLLISQMIPWQAAAAMFIRDAGMIIGSAFFHFRGKLTVPANVMGKLTTVLYYFAILFIVFELNFAITYLWFVIGVSFLTSFIYIFQFLLLNRGVRAK